MKDLKQTIARLRELDEASYALPLDHRLAKRSKGLIAALQVIAELERMIEVAREALEHYTQVVSSINNPDSWDAAIKDEGIYARKALITLNGE